MSTTTPVDGDVSASQPTNNEAVTTEGHNADQVITQDDNGTPTLAPVTSDDDQPNADAVEDAPEPAKAEPEADTTQAKTDAEIVAWTEKKGLKINPENPNEVKLARMQLEAEQKMHQATQKPVVNPPEEIPLTGTEGVDDVIERQNVTDLKLYVRDWFDANPEMKEARAELTKIAAERPWLTNMDDVKAHFLADPNRTAQLKQEGGREALTNLAQKQQAIPPSANATNSGVYESAEITKSNVYDLIDRNSQEWFQKNYDKINKAISG